MYCHNCGAQIPDGAKFCTECGAAIAANNSHSIKEGSITFIRKPSSAAKLIKTRVIVDGLEYGEIKENEQLIVSLPFGAHSVTLKCAMNPVLNTTVLVGASNSVIFPFKISMSGKPTRIDGSNGGQSANAYKPQAGSVTTAQTSYTYNADLRPKKKKSKWWIWVIVGIIILGMIGNSRPSSSSSSKVATRTTPTPTAAATPAPVVYEIGETATFNHLEFTITGYTFSQYAGGLSGLNPASQDNVHLVVYISVYNPTNKEAEITKEALMGNKLGKYHFKLAYDGDYKYNSSFANYSDFLLANDKILPLGSLTGKILNYQVPVVVQIVISL